MSSRYTERVRSAYGTGPARPTPRPSHPNNNNQQRPVVQDSKDESILPAVIAGASILFMTAWFINRTVDEEPKRTGGTLQGHASRPVVQRQSAGLLDRLFGRSASAAVEEQSEAKRPSPTLNQHLEEAKKQAETETVEGWIKYAKQLEEKIASIQQQQQQQQQRQEVKNGSVSGSSRTAATRRSRRESPVFDRDEDDRASVTSVSPPRARADDENSTLGDDYDDTNGNNNTASNTY